MELLSFLETADWGSEVLKLSVTTAASYSAAHIVMTYDDGLLVMSGLCCFHCSTGSTGFTDPLIL